MNITTDENFQNDVLASTKPTLVYLGATWCGPCRMLGMIIESVSETMGDKVDVFKMDVDDSPDTSAELNITSVPTVIIYNDGKIVDTLVGVKTVGTYINLLERI